MHTRWLVLGLGLLCLVRPSQAQIPVTDVASNARRTMEFIWMQAQEVKKYAEMVTTAQQMVEQVKGTYQMIDMAAKHLTTMPAESDMLTWLTTTNDQASTLLGQVQWLGFSLDRSSRQFETLYGNTMLLTTAEGRAERLRQMREARLEMTGIAIQTQSIRQTFSDIYARLSVLLGIASWAEGSRALQQLQMQQQALLQKQQQTGLTLAAVQARLQAMEAAERMVMEDLQRQVATEEAKRWYATQPAMAVPGFHGFMLTPGAGR
jgi:hypothetical protein